MYSRKIYSQLLIVFGFVFTSYSQNFVDKNCNIESLTSYFGGEVSNKFHYLSNTQTNVVSNKKTSLELDTIKYTYTSSGKIDSIFKSSLSMTMQKFIYDDKDRIIEIKGSDYISSSKFKYNDKGRIEEEEFFDKRTGTNRGKHIYKYDNDGNPVRYVYAGANGSIYQETIIEYDKNTKNPFQYKLGSVISPVALFGYPIANHHLNISKITILNPETKETIREEIYGNTYNDFGYPIVFGSNSFTISYLCDK